ncbi:AIM24 family protein [Paenibacillus sp. J2TS4]|uniref:AIM24 family protein n=1 Tax=Paenibacillus sp. J2TS4 TaxID=2807194 RepID=UPI001B0CF032|nr:AIM24 family protein [Paenibacillus sp. J2TS4]GIP33940.1 hypothetical protein J2TS4_31500 [Paenibacillus sp. J2TS4]
MEITYNIHPGNGQSQGMEVQLAAGEKLHMLNSEMIIAFQGDSHQREDRIMDWKGMFRKKKWLRSDLSGPCRFVLSLPAGYSVRSIPVMEQEDFLFDIRHVLFYTSGIQMKSVIQTMKNVVVTRDWIRMKFYGSGEIGILSQGPLVEMKLAPDAPVYIDASCLVAYPQNAKLDLCVYGNQLAGQHMNYHWKITGQGYVLMQTGKPGLRLEEQLKDDGLIKRMLREIIPFGGIFIK